MTARATFTILTGLVLCLGCGGKSDDRAAETPAAADTAATVAAAEPASGEAPKLATAGSVREHAEAGFQVYWPSGCGKLKEQMSNGATRRAAQEFIYTCNRDDAKGRGASIRILRQAHGPGGVAPSPPLVVEMVEKQLQKFGARAVRQRPLVAEDSEGIDVQAAEPDGSGEVWIRGLLEGADIFVLMAWNEKGGLFEDPETVDFFASFRSE